MVQPHNILACPEAFMSAEDLGKKVGATRAQILHWLRAGYLSTRKREGEYKMFPLSQVPKASVMSVLVNETGIKPQKASYLADMILEAFEKKPESTRALLIILRAMYEHLDEVLTIMTQDGVDKSLLSFARKKDLLDVGRND